MAPLSECAVPVNIKVVLVSNTAWNIYNFRGGLIRQLLSEGVAVTVVAPPDSFFERLAGMGCEVIALPMDNQGTNPLRDLKTLWHFYRIYRRVRPGTVLHYTVKPVVYGSLAARMLGIPAVNTITGLGTAFIKTGWMLRVVEWLYRLSLRWSVRVFFQNHDDSALFIGRGLVAADKAEQLPGSGVDLSRFKPVAYPNNPAPVFLLVARLLRDKGVVEFVEAARRLKARYPAARFQLLGPLGVANRTALTAEDVAAWVAEGCVEYLGVTDDVRPYLAAVDCVVLPSYREGIPRTLLEAAALGRPIITTDAPGCREVVDDSENGYICRPRDWEDLAKSMERFIRLPVAERCAMGQAGREKVEREFDERIVIERVVAEIQGLRGKGRGSRGKVQGARGKVQGSRGKVQGARGKAQGARGKRDVVRDEV